MLELIYIAIVVLAVLLAVSTWLIARKNIFEEQIRSKSVEVVWCTLQAEQETDINKAIKLFNRAEALKNEICSLMDNSTSPQKFQWVEATDLKNQQLKELSLGELQKYYDEQNNISEIYNKLYKGKN
ncbi:MULTISPECIES: hypothetical protein [unclassified Pseudoalteromonas]|uniref:hypothetical protein n=1 Tax=unclassified Pseudoalteromonas TaxID=194690 RepID=UPI001F22BD43|nr:MULTISPECIES: hypothetical protein [unclassified Pseudoalteromonas]MCF2899940.1 hypothetical protein [Pseudoalteromonas sp. OFAV1]MCO7249700.1 hypothetical protein [Pseudoalteromonas sp. Ps84H-4]